MQPPIRRGGQERPGRRGWQNVRWTLNPENRKLRTENWAPPARMYPSPLIAASRRQDPPIRRRVPSGGCRKRKSWQPSPGGVENAVSSAKLGSRTQPLPARRESSVGSGNAVPGKSVVVSRPPHTLDASWSFIPQLFGAARRCRSGFWPRVPGTIRHRRRQISYNRWGTHPARAGRALSAIGGRR